MATSQQPPKLPLISVIGATGTGKSQLAVDLALALDGEVINADAMQMYSGLPIITNKPPPSEMRGVPHHLLGFLGLQEVYHVKQFAKVAERIIEEIRGRGKIPVLVGGTHYYVQSLLFPHSLSGESEEDNPPSDSGRDLAAEHPILDAPTPELYKALQQIDPEISAKWHPNDRRKIRRSLQIYYSTGCTLTASEVYAAQRLQQQAPAGDPTHNRYRNLVFWVHAETETLRRRLDGRVEKMIENGMWSEIEDMKKNYDEIEHVDMSKGIWQSIGFKEFLPFLESRHAEQSEDAGLEELKKLGIENMKAATRRYAKYQVRWIRIKFLNALQSPSDRVFLVDSTDPDEFGKAGTATAVSIAKAFLAGEESNLPNPETLSALARENLKPKREDFASRPDLWVQKTCERCGSVCINEDQWRIHEKSAKHRRMIKGARKPETEAYIKAKGEEREKRRAELVEVLEKHMQNIQSDCTPPDCVEPEFPPPPTKGAAP